MTYIKLEDALCLPPFDGDGDPAGQFDHHIFVKLDAIRALATVEAPGGLEDDVLHSDDVAVNHFAKLMKAKMGLARAKGRGGWDDPEKCSVDYLRRLLYEHLDKGDPVDVANFCMMLKHYGASTVQPRMSGEQSPSTAEIGAVLQEAAQAAREVFSASCDHTKQAIDYMEQFAIAQLRASPDATAALQEAKAEAVKLAFRMAAGMAQNGFMLVAPEGCPQYPSLASYRAQIRNNILAMSDDPEAIRKAVEGE